MRFRLLRSLLSSPLPSSPSLQPPSSLPPLLPSLPPLLIPPPPHLLLPTSLSDSCMIHGAAAWDEFYFVTGHALHCLRSDPTATVGFVEVDGSGFRRFLDVCRSLDLHQTRLCDHDSSPGEDDRASDSSSDDSSSEEEEDAGAQNTSQVRNVLEEKEDPWVMRMRRELGADDDLEESDGQDPDSEEEGPEVGIFNLSTSESSSPNLFVAESSSPKLLLRSSSPITCS